MVTLLWPGKEFKISHQEMIKGMRIGGIGNALSCEFRRLLPTTIVVPALFYRSSSEVMRVHALQSRRAMC